MAFIAGLYTVLIAFLNVDADVSTNLINPADPVQLTPHEIKVRTWGSKTVLLVEQCMCAVQWGTKSCLLLLYWRLTQNLTQNLVVKCAAVYVGVTYVVMEVFYFAVWCRPFHEYWALPSTNPQCTTALHHLIMNMCFNISSDILIMSIPLPLLLRAHLELKRKMLLVFPFSLGLFTIVCAVLSKHLSFTQPYSAVWVFWYCREASTAMIVTNMPYSWALIRRIFNLKSFFGDSTHERVQARHARELHGYSLGTMGARESQTRLRQESQAEGPAKSWLWHKSDKRRKSSDSERDQPTPEADSGKTGGVAVKHEEVDIEDGIAMGLSGRSSTTDSIRKPPPVATTADALDKLYPLDDDDKLDHVVLDVMRRRYEG